jgi:hypothetical protein
VQFLGRLRKARMVEKVSGTLDDGPFEGIAECRYLSGIELGTELREDGQNIVEATARLGIAEKIEQRQFYRRDFHFAGIGFVVLETRGNFGQVLFEVEDDFRSADLYISHLLAGHDLKFHDCLMRGAMKLCGFQEAHIVGPFLMAHEIIYEGCRRRTSEIKVLGWYDDVEALPRVQNPSALLEFLGGCEESPPAYAESGLSFVARINQSASSQQSCDIGGQACPGGLWFIIHSRLI